MEQPDYCLRSCTRCTVLVLSVRTVVTVVAQRRTEMAVVPDIAADADSWHAGVTRKDTGLESAP